MSGWRTSFERWQPTPYVVLVGALSLTAIGAGLAQHELNRREAATFHHAIEEVEARIHMRIDTSIALLRGVAGLMAAQSDLDQDRFHRFATHLEMEVHYPGIHGIGYAPRILAAERPRFVSDVRQQMPSFHIWPPADAPESYPVRFIEPTDERNRAAFGYDVVTDPTRREALEAARDQGLPKLTGRVILVQEISPPRQAGISLFLPVYLRGESPPTTIEARRCDIMGIAFAPIRCKELFDTIDGTRGPIDYAIYDGPDENSSHLLHRSADPSTRPAGYEFTHAVEFAGRSWTIHYLSQPDLLLPRGTVAFILAAGLLASSLLFITSLRQGRSRDRALASAAELARSEAALKRNEASLRFLAEASAILNSSLEYQTTLANVAASAVPTFADWAAVDLLLEDGSLQRLTMVHRDPAKLAIAEQLHRHYPPNPDQPPHTVIASRTSLMIPDITEAMVASSARDIDHLSLLRSLNLSSVIISPLLTYDRVLGAITFVTSDSGRHYGPEDVAIAENLAHRAAVAIENSRLFFETDRLRALAEATSEELAHHTKELTHSNAELEQFAYVASHDLQEPLRMITSYLDLLKRRYGDRFQGPPEEYMSFVIDGARRMQALIRDLLTFSRVGRQDGEMELVGLESVLAVTLQNLAQAIADSGATITHDPLPEIVADRMQLVQLLQNLIANALKFRGSQTPRVHLGARREPQGWEFTVTDNGIGIDPTHSERIFELFQRLHSREHYAGTGIGLAICRKIVERRGGRIRTYPAAGGGSVFAFTVPDR